VEAGEVQLLRVQFLLVQLEVLVERVRHLHYLGHQLLMLEAVEVLVHKLVVQAVRAVQEEVVRVAMVE
jgi:hypothetical protein